MERKIFSQAIDSGAPRGGTPCGAGASLPEPEAFEKGAPDTTPFGYAPPAGAELDPGGIARASARLPRWLKIKGGFSPEYVRVKKIMQRHGMHTVCAEAACPNIRECWGEGSATFMILGKYCTRGCNFCDVMTGRPVGLDTDEPRRLAASVAELGLKQVVITSVTRDDLPDGGAEIFYQTLIELRARDPQVKVEILIPDMQGEMRNVERTLEATPDVFAHNVETVARLYRRVRPGAELQRSLDVLRFGNEYSPRPVVKTGFMVGLGETTDEIVELYHQIRATGTDIVTVGQYLRPSSKHLPVEKFYTPEEFVELARIGRDIGFGHVEAGPLVRSSYKAFSQSKQLLKITEVGAA